MLKRKHIILAGAVAAVIPSVTRAATVVFSYESSVNFFTDASMNTPDATTPSGTIGGTAAAPTLTVPAGDYFALGATVQVTGNTNQAGPSGTLPARTYSNQGGTFAQPTNLGFGGFLAFMANNSITKLNAVGVDGSISPLQDSKTFVNTSVFSVSTPGYIQATGTVGENDATQSDPIAGVISVPTANSATAGGKATVSQGVSSPIELFNTLEYKAAANATGTATLTPTTDTNGTNTSLATYNSGGTSTSNKPVYGVRGLNGSDGLSGHDSVTFLAPLVISFSGSVSTAQPIVSLTAAAPSTYGSLEAGSPLVVVGGNGRYNVAKITGLTSGKAYVEGKGFNNPATDTEIYGLDVLGATNLTSLIADIQAALPVGDTATAVYPGPGASPLGAEMNVFISIVGGGPGIGDNFLGFDFSQATLAGNQTATVSEIALVPEPASMAGLLIGASGLLMGRRKRKA